MGTRRGLQLSMTAIDHIGDNRFLCSQFVGTVAATRPLRFFGHLTYRAQSIAPAAAP